MTVTSTVPELPAGEVAVIEPSSLTVNDSAAVEPKSTALAPVKPVPVIVNEVPPDTCPTVGSILVTVGAGSYVNWSALVVADCPPSVVVTVTSTVPRVPAGEVAVIELSELNVNDVAAFDPKSTAVTPVKPVPLIETEVPPAIGPAVGLMLVTVGGGS